MIDFIQLILNLVEEYGYLGAFIGSLLGNITVALPTPYAFMIAALGVNLNPFILGLVSGLGSTIGELVSYLAGRAGRRMINPRQKERLDRVKALIDRYGPWVIVLFAVTPLPDDLLLVPLGLMSYDFRTLAVSVWLGKTMLTLFLAYAGYYGFIYMGNIFQSSGYIGLVVSLVAIALMVFALLRLDWDRYI